MKKPILKQWTKTDQKLNVRRVYYSNKKLRSRLINEFPHGIPKMIQLKRHMEFDHSTAVPYIKPKGKLNCNKTLLSLQNSYANCLTWIFIFSFFFFFVMATEKCLCSCVLEVQSLDRRTDRQRFLSFKVPFLPFEYATLKKYHWKLKNGTLPWSNYTDNAGQLKTRFSFFAVSL